MTVLSVFSADVLISKYNTSSWMPKKDGFDRRTSWTASKIPQSLFIVVQLEFPLHLEPAILLRHYLSFKKFSKQALRNITDTLKPERFKVNTVYKFSP
jgi:hypothetical protein